MSTEVLATGGGTIYSWIVVRRAMGTLASDDLPVTFLTVELDEGCRTVGRLTDQRSVDFDVRVTANYIDHPTWTELCFALEGEDKADG